MAVQLQFVYPGARSADLDRRVRLFNRQRNQDNISAAVVRLDDLELLHEDYAGSTGRVHRGQLAVAPGSARVQDGSYGRALVATIPGNGLKALWSLLGL